MSPETVSAWFTPFHYVVYLGAIFIIMVVYYQFKWTKICKTHVLVLIQRATGRGDYELAPQEKGSITLENPKSHRRQMWAINELATIDVPYPGVGFIPLAMQKTIRMCIVTEEDWEPILNRSTYNQRVASPDVIAWVKELANKSTGDVQKKLSDYAKTLHTAPTRAMIASPAVLGNLMHEKITEAVITVNKEMMDSLEGLIKKLNNLVNPIVVYIMLGVILVVSAYTAYNLVSAVSGMEELSTVGADVTLIKRALGIP